VGEKKSTVLESKAISAEVAPTRKTVFLVTFDRHLMDFNGFERTFL
jgi:hypothetical protein